MCKAYLHAKQIGADFFIDHDDWQYTAAKGWHDYFTSCKLYDKSMQYDTVDRFKHANVISQEFTAAQYADACKELFKPAKQFLDKAEAFRSGIGGPYTSLYVRRGDKVNGITKEMDLLSVEQILDTTGIANDGRKLFVQTDDYGVVEEIHKLRPSVVVKTLTPSTERGASFASIKAMSADQRRAHMEELIVSSLCLVKGTPAWSDIRSNVGRFHILYAYGAVKMYPKSGESEIVPAGKTVKPYEGL
jgi:hypothetical protein